MKKTDVAKKMNHDVSKGYDVKKGSKRFQNLKQKGLESVLMPKGEKSEGETMNINPKTGNQRT